MKEGIVPKIRIRMPFIHDVNRFIDNMYIYMLSIGRVIKRIMCIIADVLFFFTNGGIIAHMPICFSRKIEFQINVYFN